MTSARSTPPAALPTRRSAFGLGCLAFGVIGLVARVLPLLDREGRMIRQWPTEDSYLSLQIARNMALGHGMSVSEGTIATNGTQPFWTWVWSLVYRLVDGDKLDGVLLVQIVELALAIACAALIVVVGRRLTGDRDAARLAACAWFASPIVIPHSMNCLESGGYALAVLLSLAVITKVEHPPGRWPLTRCLAVGTVLGWAFWVRNDAAFLIAATCLVHWLSAVRAKTSPLFGRSLAEAVGIGLVTVAIASPWLYYNQTTFGHLMPISGIAESHYASFGHNAHLISASVFEYFALLLPIPEKMEGTPGVVLLTTLVDAVLVVLAVRFVKARSALAYPAAIIGVFALCVVGYYGLYFGAAHFVSRYLFPLSPFFALVTAMLALHAWRKLAARHYGTTLAALGLGLAVIMSALLAWRLHRRAATEHMHFQVVAWVQRNVPQDAWVGAIQTGTLGYWHDRTYNLDGKVNPYALEAKLRDDLSGYVDSTGLQYIADWAPITDWIEQPYYARHFEVVVRDAQHNLGVMRRRDVAR